MPKSKSKNPVKSQTRHGRPTIKSLTRQLRDTERKLELARSESAQEPTYEGVRSAALRWYRAELARIVDRLIREGRCDTETMTRRVNETTDDHRLVIHFGLASLVSFASNHEDAYQDEYGEPAPTPEAAACAALRADVLELLESRSDEWEPLDEDPDETLIPRAAAVGREISDLQISDAMRLDERLEFQALRREAESAGNRDLVTLCRVALGERSGDRTAARAECRRVIALAVARRRVIALAVAQEGK